ncbi:MULTISPECIES: phosphatase PAP2 family protein [Streptomyces violaceusniger group]|nr:MULTISPECIES: phosphatase PAP2 family protein [Streptomyces violaceusniger group]
MSLPTGIRETDRTLAKRLAASASPGLHRALSTVEETAEGSKLWCGAAAVMALMGGRRGRRSAIAGLAAVTAAQLVSNGVCKQLADRPRPPKEWFPHDEVEDRPDSSSFPSGHTAAAVAFTTAVAPSWPLAGVLCGVPAAMVAVERVQSGAQLPQRRRRRRRHRHGQRLAHPPRPTPDPAPLASAIEPRAGARTADAVRASRRKTGRASCVPVRERETRKR